MWAIKVKKISHGGRNSYDQNFFLQNISNFIAEWRGGKFSVASSIGNFYKKANSLKRQGSKYETFIDGCWTHSSYKNLTGDRINFDESSEFYELLRPLRKQKHYNV
jgi:hypothetical protein